MPHSVSGPSSSAVIAHPTTSSAAPPSASCADSLVQSPVVRAVGDVGQSGPSESTLAPSSTAHPTVTVVVFVVELVVFVVVVVVSWWCHCWSLL